MAKKDNSIGKEFMRDVITTYGPNKIIGVIGLGIVGATLGISTGIIFIPNVGEKYIKIKINKEEL